MHVRVPWVHYRNPAEPLSLPRLLAQQPPATYSYLALYQDVGSNFGLLSNLSPLVDNLLLSIMSAETWGIPKAQVAVTRVIIGVTDVLAASGTLDWDFVSRYPYSGGDVIFQFEVSVNASVPPPVDNRLVGTAGLNEVTRLYGGEQHARTCTK